MATLVADDPDPRKREALEDPVSTPHQSPKNGERCRSNKSGEHNGVRVFVDLERAQEKDTSKKNVSCKELKASDHITNEEGWWDGISDICYRP